MKKNPASQSGIFNPRVLLAMALCSVGVFLAALGFAATPTTPLAPTGPGWSIVTSPNTSATQNDYLKSVACASASDCWAVGYYLTGNNTPQTLIEHWNGTSWAIIASPNTSATQGNALSAVACASASACWAVGSYNNGNVNRTLIERWNGTSWAIITSPNNGTMGNGLSGVTCSASECWAVGWYLYATGDLFTPSALGTLIERWAGTSWDIVASPNPEVDFCGTLACAILDSPLVAVTCASASDCWAIGNAGIDVLFEHWDGSSWAIVASPSFNEQYAVPKAVTCASASECWAVGYYYDGGAPEPENHAFIERWDGTSWAFVSPPNTTLLSGVTCVSASDCWAVGPPIEHWGGTSWAIVTSPNTSGYLNSVTCTSASQCWAVGNYVSGTGYYQTLIEEYAPTIPPLTSVVSRKVHGSAGTFDIDLPLTGPGGVECRSGGANGAYKMVFSFVNNVTNCGTASIGSLSSGPGPNRCTVNLAGVANQQNLTVTLSNVLDSQNNTGNVSATMGVLIGDTGGNRSVNSSDVSQTKSKSGQAANSTNFRTDVSVNGTINSSDVSLVKSKSGTALP
jgi:hypothetical protein